MSTALERIVVVGAGLAGTATVTALRERGFTGRIDVVAAEPGEPYDRPPLSKHVLAADGAEPPTLRAELGLDLTVSADRVHAGVRATALRRRGAGWVVELGSGDRLTTDGVVVATGAAPWLPPALRGNGVVAVRTRDDAVGLRARLRRGDRVVCIGAGWIGAEVATAAAARGCEVVVLEAGPAPLHHALGCDVGALVTPWFAAAGIVLRTGVTAVGLGSGGVMLAGGEQVPADVVVGGTGVRPDVEWLAGSSLDVGPGVRVDEHLAARSGDEPAVGVVAVGDCATRWSPRYDAWLTPEHWDEALQGPQVAAATVLGEPGAGYDVPPYVFSTHLGRELAFVGRRTDGDRLVVRGDPAAGPWSALWWRPGLDDRPILTAAFTVDSPRELSQTRKALRRAPGVGVPVNLDALGDNDSSLRDALLPS